MNNSDNDENSLNEYDLPNTMIQDDNHEINHTEHVLQTRKADDYDKTKISLQGLGRVELPNMNQHPVGVNTSMDAMNEYLMENMHQIVDAGMDLHADPVNSNLLDGNGSPGDSSLQDRENVLSFSSSSDEENQVLVWQDDRIFGNSGSEGGPRPNFRHVVLPQMASQQASEDFIDIDMLPRPASSELSGEDLGAADMDDRSSTDSQNADGPLPLFGGVMAQGGGGLCTMRQQGDRSFSGSDSWNNLNQRLPGSHRDTHGPSLGPPAPHPHPHHALPLGNPAPLPHGAPEDWNFGGYSAPARNVEMMDQGDDADSESSEPDRTNGSNDLDASRVVARALRDVTTRTEEEVTSQGNTGSFNLQAGPSGQTSSFSQRVRVPSARLPGLNGLAPSASTGHLLDISPHLSSSSSTCQRPRLRHPQIAVQTSTDTEDSRQKSSGLRSASADPLPPASPGEYSRLTNGGGNMEEDSMVRVWSELEASLSQRAHRTPTECGPVAVVNVLRALGLSSCCSVEELTAAFPHSQRAALSATNEAPSLPQYLLSRSRLGVSADEVVRVVHDRLGQVVRARFFSTQPRRNLQLCSWLQYWMRLGGIPMLTLNLQRGVPALYVIPDSAWHHHMVYAVGERSIYMTNPVQAVPESVVLEQLCSPSVLLVRKSDLLTRWDRHTDLTQLCGHEDPAWDQMNVLGQVVCTIRETQHETFPGFQPEWAHHIRIPCSHWRPGITIFVPAARTDLCRTLEEAPELPLASEQMISSCHSNPRVNGDAFDRGGVSNSR